MRLEWRTKAILALGFCAMVAGTPAVAATPADAFIQQGTEKAISILTDRSASDADKRGKMEDLMATLLDLKRMAIFALGPAARSASPAEVDAYIDAYRAFALANYTAELSGYMGQTIEITGSAARAPGDYIVSALVRDPNDKRSPPAPVSFRVLDEGGGRLALVDAAVEGVWFTLAQRDDFNGFLSQNGGDIAKLVEHLKTMAAHPDPQGQAAR